MAIAMRCDTCGEVAPSLGSLQMHRLRYHSSSSAPSTASGPNVSAPPPPSGHRSGQPDRGPSPPRTRRSSAIAPLALAVLALLSGGAFAVTRSSRSDAPPTLAALQSAAHRAVLTSADLPAGWTATPPDPADDAASENDRALAECMGATYEDGPTEARSSFSSAGLSAGADFSIASSVERARSDFAALAGPAAAGCFEQMMRKSFDADKLADGSYDIKVAPSDLVAGLPRDADHDAVGIRVTATFHRGKAAVPLAFEFVMLRYDRIEGMLTFTSVADPPFPPDVARSLTNATAQRLANAA